MKLNDKDFIYKTDKNELQIIFKYIEYCKFNACGQLDILNNSYEFEQLLLFNINTMLEKFANLLYKNLHELPKKTIKLKVNKAERISLSIMFNRLPVHISISHFELFIIHKLKS